MSTETELELFEIFRAQICKDFPNADPIIVDFNVEFLKELAQETDYDVRLAGLFAKVSKQVFNRIYQH